MQEQINPQRRGLGKVRVGKVGLGTLNRFDGGVCERRKWKNGTARSCAGLVPLVKIAKLPHYEATFVKIGSR